MEELEKLYTVISEKGLYTKSFEEFQEQYNDPAYRDKVFEAVTQRGLYTNTREDFDSKYSPTSEKKNPNETSPSDSEEVITDSTIITENQDGVSDSSEEINEFEVYRNLDDDIDTYINTNYTQKDPKPRSTSNNFFQGFLKASNQSGFGTAAYGGGIANTPFVMEEQTRVYPKVYQNSPEDKKAALNLKKKLEADPNIKAALNLGILPNNIIDEALDGDKEAVANLKLVTSKSQDELLEFFKEKKLDNIYEYKDNSNIQYELMPKEEADSLKKKYLESKKKIDFYNKYKAKKVDEFYAENLKEVPGTERTLKDGTVVSDQEYDEDALAAIITAPIPIGEEFPTQEDYDFVTEYEDNFGDRDPATTTKVNTAFQERLGKMYNVHDLMRIPEEGEVANFLRDFDGYMQQGGHYDEYFRLLEDETISDYDRTGKYISKSWGMLPIGYDAELAAEQIRAKHLNNYFAHIGKKKELAALTEYQLNNDGQFPWAKGEMLEVDYGFDPEAILAYIEEDMPLLTTALKEVDQQNQENYQKYLDGDSQWFRQSAEGGWAAVAGRLNDFGAWLMDGTFLGDESRMIIAQNDLYTEDTGKYVYASGLEGKFSGDGRNYLVDDRGQVYDTEIKANVTNYITPEKYAQITSEIRKFGTEGSTFSGAGATVATTGVLADVVLQIAFTKGVTSTISGTSRVASMFPRGKVIVDGISKVPINQVTASAMLVQGTLASSTISENAFQAALNSGLSQKEAAEIRDIASSQGFILGAVTAPISTQRFSMDKLFGKGGQDKIVQGAVQSYLQGGRKGTESYFRKLYDQAARNYVGYLKEGGREIVQENVFEAGEVYAINPDLNQVAGQEIMRTTITGDEFKVMTGLSGFVGLLIPFAGDVSTTTNAAIKARYRPKDAAFDRLVALNEMSKNPKKTEEYLRSLSANGAFGEAEIQAVLNDIEAYRNTINQVPSELTPEGTLIVIKNLNEINKLTEQKKQRDESLHGELDTKIAEARKKIQAVVEVENLSDTSFTNLGVAAGDVLMQSARDKQADQENASIELTNDEIVQEIFRIYENLSDADKKLVKESPKKWLAKWRSSQESKTEQPTNTQQDAIQEQETGEVSDDQQSETVQEVETEVRESSEETQTEEEVAEDKNYAKSPFLLKSREKVGKNRTLEGNELKMNEKYIDTVIEDGIKKGKTADEIFTKLAQRFGLDDIAKGELFNYIKGKFSGEITTDISTFRKGKPASETTTDQETQTDTETDTETDTDTDTETETTEDTEVERIKDSQIPVSQQKFTVEMPDGEVVDATITTQLDGSRRLKIGNDRVQNISKDNTLSNEEYLTEAAGEIQTTEDVDITTVRNPKMEGKMSTRQRKAAGMSVNNEVDTDTDTETETPGATSIKNIAESITRATTRKDYREQQKIVLDEVSKQVKSGNIKARDARILNNKIKNTSFDNETQVQSLIDYATNLFKDADYKAKTDQATKVSTATRKKLNTGRLGYGTAFNSTLSQILSIPVSDIDPGDLDAYNEFMTEIGKRQSATRVDKEFQNYANELLTRLQNNKKADVESEQTFDEDKGFRYDESTEKIIEKINNPDVSGEKLIEENSEFLDNDLSKLNSVSLRNVVEKVNAAETTENSDLVQRINDYAENRVKIIKETAKQSKNTNTKALPSTAKEQEVGAETLTNLSPADISFLSGKQIEQLQVHLANIADGIYTHQANNLAQRIQANRDAAAITPVIEGAYDKRNNFLIIRSRLRAKGKRWLIDNNYLSQAGKDARGVGEVGEMIRSNPLDVLDQFFMNFKNNKVRETIIDPTAKQYAAYENFMDETTDKILRAENLLYPKRYSMEGQNSAVKKKYEITTYLLAKEYQANKGKKGVASPDEFIEKTIENHKKNKNNSRIKDRDVEALLEIQKKYSVDGEISVEKMDAELDPQTKKAIKIFQEVYESLGEKQLYATSIVRGDNIELSDNYVHHKVEVNKEKDNETIIEQTKSITDYQPGTKSKTSYSRTPGAKPIDFDPVSTVLRAVKNTALDFYLTNQVSTTRQALSTTRKNIGGEQTGQEKTYSENAAQDLQTVYNEALTVVVGNSTSSSVVGGSRMNRLRTAGYYAMLASLPRAGAEYLSNSYYALTTRPEEYISGITKYSSYSLNKTGLGVVENTKSKSRTKLFGDEILGGSKADQLGVDKKKISSKKLKSENDEVLDIIKRYYGLDLLGQGIEKIGETLIAGPDKAVSRPLWFGTFASTFKQETGQEVNFEKIAENDTEYMKENAAAIKKATTEADNAVTESTTTNNPFGQTLKLQARQNEQALNYYRMINGFMSKFSLNEAVNAKQGLASALGIGKYSRLMGGAITQATYMRMALYMVSLVGLSNLMLSMFGLKKDEEEEDYPQMLKRQLVGSMASLITRNTEGNLINNALMYFLEAANEEYGYDLGLRDSKKYDPYKDSAVFSPYNEANMTGDKAWKTIGRQMLGPAMPVVRSLEELTYQFPEMIRGDSPVPAGLQSLYVMSQLGNVMGYSPFYRDIRKMYNEQRYGGKKKKNDASALLKLLNPELYKKNLKEFRFQDDDVIKQFRKQNREMEKFLKGN